MKVRTVTLTLVTSALLALYSGCGNDGSNPPGIGAGNDAGGIVHHDSAIPDAPSGDTGPNPATCTDHVKNGNETDVDCGGSTCPPCADTQHCAAPTDCKSGNCVAMTCVAATCMDHIKNGKETDIDCGGGDCTPCLVGKSCKGTADCQSNICTNGTCLCTGGMVTIPTALTLGGSYCIDPTEVTKKEYNDFWVANPNLGTNLPASCSFKTSYTPSSDWPPTLTSSGYNGGDPVHYVDWCDAYAYCRWKGKRLCGAIAGGAVPQASLADRLQDAWYNACSALGANAWPYGSSYNPNAFYGADKFIDAGPPDISPVRDMGSNIVTSCQGGASGLYMMSGNVAEWEDSCDASAGSSDNCLVRGGSYTSNMNQLRCDAMAAATRGTRSATLGFRCCL